MHAMLTALAARSGCYSSGPSTVYSPQCRIGEVFQHVTITAAYDDHYEITDTEAPGALFIVTPQSGELVKLIED